MPKAKIIESQMILKSLGAKKKTKKTKGLCLGEE
jgi:hypothetical protein